MRLAPSIILLALLLAPPALAQRTTENAVAEAGDAFGSVVGNEVIGLYTSASARGFNPSQAGNLRIQGLYFDQAGAPNNRLLRGSTVHVGISAQGYPFAAPTGVVDFDLRVPGAKAVTSVLVGHGAVLGYSRPVVEVDAQTPVIRDVLSVGAGISYTRNHAHQVAVRDRNVNGSLIAHWTPSATFTLTPFWSGLDTEAVGGDRPRVFIGENAAPRYRQQDLNAPEWLFFGFKQYNYGGVAEWTLPEDWKIEAGLFRSEANTPNAFTGFVLNTNAQGFGDYAIERTPARYTRSTSGELRLSKTFIENVRRHTFYVTARGRDRDSTFGGGDLKRFGRVALTAIPLLPEPVFQPGATTRSTTRQATGGVAYEGVWSKVGQLSLSLQRSEYERTLVRPGAAPVEGRKSPLLANAAGAVYVSSDLAVFASYARGLEELGTAPGNAVNRDEAPPAELTRQFDAGVRYQLRPGLQLVADAFLIDKPYYALDAARVFRQLGDIRHSGIEISLAGSLTSELTLVAGAVALKPKIGGAAGAAKLTEVGPVPRLVRANLQYRPKAVPGLALDAKLESVSSRVLTVSNAFRVSGAVTVDAGVRYTTTFAAVPVRFRLQGLNLTNAFSVTPNASGQINAFESRRVEATIAVDF
ncbi:MAG: TonB-dependent receptor [Rhodospirillaceae bacterium]|nr:TonB-dependent receptor [Rhodospirillaceae bacterium]